MRLIGAPYLRQLPGRSDGEEEDQAMTFACSPGKFWPDTVVALVPHLSIMQPTLDWFDGDWQP